LEFCTLRHAKYSTATILYYLHNNDAPGMVPLCTACGEEIKSVRWHKIGHVMERRTSVKRVSTAGRKGAAAAPLSLGFQSEELCSTCHCQHAHGDQFIPLQVSFSS
jgi:hypothetical protein